MTICLGQEDTDSVASISDNVWASKFTAASSCTLTALKAYCRIDSGNAGVMGIYSHDSINDEPEDLLRQSNELAGVDSNYNWKEFTLTSPITLVASTIYWLAIYSEDVSDLYLYRDDSSNKRSSAGQVASYPDLPDPWNEVASGTNSHTMKGESIPLGPLPMFNPQISSQENR